MTYTWCRSEFDHEWIWNYKDKNGCHVSIKNFDGKTLRCRRCKKIARVINQEILA